ncbi:MAG: PepSY domain-containing protein [Burkholderiaceae bacterium]
MSGETVGRRPCPECGAQLRWNPARQALACDYCGTVVPDTVLTPEGQQAGIEEHDLLAALRDAGSSERDWGPARREVRCESCHAVSVFVDGRVAQQCEFCGSPSILAHEAHRDAITPQSLLPIKIDESTVRDSLRQWYGSRWFAPDRLKKAALTDTLHGIYLPYWTFDARVHARWRAEAGHYYYVAEQYTDSKGRRGTRQVRHVRWEPAAGELTHFFDDDLVPGSVGVNPALLRQIEPFPTTTDLQPYSAEFVRGWAVERYQVDLGAAAGASQQNLQRRTEALCSAQVPGDTQRNLQVDARFDERRFKHVLVPVWLVSYTFGSRHYQIVVNAYTGKIAGQRPISWVKVALAVVAVLVLVVVFASLGGR